MTTDRQLLSICFILTLSVLSLVAAEDSEFIKGDAVATPGKALSAVDAESAEWKAELAIRSGWWSLQPSKDIKSPTISEATRAMDPVDLFILQSLNEAKLSPAKPADAETLLRRISYVLTGLPANSEKMGPFRKAFTRDADDAFEALVDELLASRHFGERFARHWMDVVRYTDTYGYEWDNPAKGAWEYRDYLIRAFNDDVAFDQLIREQIAGDLLPEPRINTEEGVNESMIGPMFYHMGEHRHETSLQFNGVHQEMINNKIDAFSKTFLAMTVACARCHDHKIDAVSQRDYYALAGVFMSPRWTTRVIDANGKYDAKIAELKRLRSTIRQDVAQLWQSSSNPDTLAKELKQWASEQKSNMNSESEPDTISESEADADSESDEKKLEDIAYLLGRVAEASNETIAEVWTTLVAEWQTMRDSRQQENAGKFTLLTDFKEPGFPKGWTMEGEGIVHGYVKDAMPLVSLTGNTLIDQLLPRGYHTHALSSKLAGALRLPEQSELSGQYISLELRGGEWAGTLVTPQNAFQNESISFFVPGAPAEWISIEDSELKNGVTKMYAQIVTASMNSNFPPRMGRALVGDVKLPAEDDGLNHRSWFSLTGIATHEKEGGPENTLDEYGPLFSGTRPATTDEAWQNLAKWFVASIDKFTSNQTAPEDVQLVNWLLLHSLLPNSTDEAPDVAALVKQYREVEAGIDFTRTVNSMDEREVEPMDYRINLRGNVYDEGPPVPRNFLGVFAGNHQVDQSKQSGRLELARYLSSPENPQTARVYVNRIWHWIFGTGLVATPNDFGKLGDRPSHPELLDWLTNTFRAEGWSTKKLVRRLVLSQSFRQSGEVDHAATERDPANRLLHHYPTRRLEAEAIRDSLLAISGRLDPTLYGPPINPVRSLEDPLKRLLSGPLDGNGRRSIYIEMSIMDPPKFLVGFNLPNPKLSTGRRDVTNVPAQALLLLNHPFVTEMAKQWADRLVMDGSTTPQERIGRMFVRAFCRSATSHELTRWNQAFEAFSQIEDEMNDKKAWADMAHVLYNTKEFIYYR
ncbi:MAG: DUF1549 and DUF1553 domain-containing protein [Verrucomicrobia bacterium]|nr:DUF1549 and DUF1553 domain-containing protein [Verrucomicrobiota bacterium]